MQKFKPVLIELIWIAIILNVTVLISIFIFNWTFLGSNFDIRLQDRYFTIASWKIILPLFIFITFICFIVKEVKYQFTRKVPNMFILCAGVLLIILLTAINKQIVLSEITFFGGWTAAPPLSALTETHVKATLRPGIHVASNFITVVQLVVTMSMMYVAFRMGVNYYGAVVPLNTHKPKALTPITKVKEEVKEVKKSSGQ
jgi:hypothetical protein